MGRQTLSPDAGGALPDRPATLAMLIASAYVNSALIRSISLLFSSHPMRSYRLVAAAGLLFVASQTSHAQTCNGTASFSSAIARIGAGLQIADHAKSYGVELALGSQAGPFGSATLSRAEYDDLANAGTVLGLAAGYALDLNPAKTVQFCPVASFGYQTGPDVTVGTTTLNTTDHSFAFGGSFGGAIPMSPTLDFVPFAGAAYTTERLTVSAGGQSESQSEDYVHIGVGAGFVINKKLTIQPAVSIPVGLDGGKASFQFAFAYNFGSASPSK